MNKKHFFHTEKEAIDEVYRLKDDLQEPPIWVNCENSHLHFLTGFQYFVGERVEYIDAVREAREFMDSCFLLYDSPAGIKYGIIAVQMPGIAGHPYIVLRSTNIWGCLFYISTVKEELDEETRERIHNIQETLQVENHKIRMN